MAERQLPKVDNSCVFNNVQKWQRVKGVENGDIASIHAGIDAIQRSTLHNKKPRQGCVLVGLFVLRDLCGFLHPCRQNLPEEPPLITQSAVGSTPPPQQTTSNR